MARFYDPQLARFISADTLVPEPGNLKSYDRYGYVNNNPIRFNDPSGHMMNVDDGGSCVGKHCLPDSNLFCPVLGNDYTSSQEINTSTTYFRSSPVIRNYDEESYDDSGNSKMNSIVGITPIKSGTVLDAIALGIVLVQDIDQQVNMRQSIQKLLGNPPDVISQVYYQNLVTGIRKNDIPYIQVSRIMITNNFVEPINHTLLKFKSTNVNSEVTQTQFLDVWETIPPNSSLVIDFTDSLLISEGYTLNIYLDYVTKGFIGKTSHSLQP